MRPTRWIRRAAVLCLLLGVTVLGAGWAALGAAREEAPARTAERAAKAPGEAKLPPLPKRMRPQVVTPVAGGGGSEDQGGVHDERDGV